MEKKSKKSTSAHAIPSQRVKSFERYDDIRKELMTSNELMEQDAEIQLEVDALRDMQNSVCRAVTSYMSENKIGFNEFTRRMKTSTRQSAKILKGQANLTLATIAELASLMGKRPRIYFD